MNENEIRQKIAKEIEHKLGIVLENCACLGRDAYGDYIEKCKKSILMEIKKEL